MTEEIRVDVGGRLLAVEATLLMIQERLKGIESNCRACSVNALTRFDRASGIGREETKAVEVKIDALAERLRAVEIRTAFFAGGAALIGALLGIFGTRLVGG
jgi:hypothetical protein